MKLKTNTNLWRAPALALRSGSGYTLVALWQGYAKATLPQRLPLLSLTQPSHTI